MAISNLSEDIAEISLIHRQHYENWVLWRNLTLTLLILCTGIFISIDLYNISDGKNIFSLNHDEIIKSRYLFKKILTDSRYTTEKRKSSATYLVSDQFNSHNDWNISKNGERLNRTPIGFHYSDGLHRGNGHLYHMAKTCLNMESIHWNMILWNDNAYYSREAFIRVVNLRSEGSYVYFEDTGLLDSKISYEKEVTQRFDNLTFLLPFSTGLSVHVNVNNIRLLPEYEDVEHPASDNGIVLDSSRKSNMQHWRKPLETIIKTSCRHPLPKQYYLAMHPYLDRHTTARRHVCQLNSHRSYLCPANYPSGFVFYDRSINGQCTQNKASYLPPQLNSFYCTVNSPLVNQLFQETIVESQSYLKDMHCDTQRRICQTCLKQSCRSSKQEGKSEANLKHVQNDVTGSHGDIVNNYKFGDKAISETLLQVNDIVQNTWAVSNPDCCNVNCYSNPSCLDYFGARCELYTGRHSNATEICLQGKTLKFTLNPEFELNNGTYTCHVRHTSPKILYTVETWLTLEIPNPLNFIWHSSRLRHEIHLMNLKRFPSRKINRMEDRIQVLQKIFQKHGAIQLWNGIIYMEHRTELPIWNDAIVHRSVDKEISLYQLKNLKDFGKELPILQRHKEEKYIVVQFSKPFQFSTANWGNQTCEINISHIHRSQPIYAEYSKVPVKLAAGIQKTISNTFLYTFKDVDKGSTIEIKTNKNHSLLYTAVCLNGLTFKPLKYSKFKEEMNARNDGKHSDNTVGRLNSDLQISTKRLKTNCEFNATWRVEISGSTTHKPTYIHLKLFTGSLKSSSSSNEGGPLRTNQQENILLEKDLILLHDTFDSAFGKSENDSEHFRIQFHVEQIQFPFVSSPTPRSILLIIHIQDCFTDYLLSTPLEFSENVKSSRSINSDLNNNMLNHYLPSRVESLRADKMHLPFVITCLVIGLTYIILLTIYAVLKICQGSHKLHAHGIVVNGARNYIPTDEIQRRGYSPFSVCTTSLLGSGSQSNLTCPQKFFIMTYLCFRVFYTFLFTISVGLSFVLSIETDATVEFTSAVYSNHFTTVNTLGRYNENFDVKLNLPSMMSTVSLPADIGNRWRGAKVWVLEAARMEDFSHSELLRQVSTDKFLLLI
ncbi:unnamed protein product [Heterobilharzia americana]|nr:unnamed protein product [Heterobilharzia americana]